MNALLGVLFGLLSMSGFGIVDYVVGGSAKKIGAFRTSFWGLASRMPMMLILIPIFMKGYNLNAFLLAVIALAGIAAAAGALGLSKGMRVGNISIISPITASYPIVTILLSLAFLNQQITPIEEACIALIMLGTVLVSLNIANILKSGTRKTHLGIEFAMVSALGWGFFFFFITVLTEHVGWFASMLFVSVPQFLFYLAYGHFNKEEFGTFSSNSKAFLAIGILGIIGFIGYNVGVTYTYTAIVTPISAASIVITVLMAVALLKEKLTIHQKFGIVM